MNKIMEIEKSFMKKNIPDFKTGDTVKVSVTIKEGDKTRLQAFEGIIIAKKGMGLKQTFTVRKISYGEGVERIFQTHSPSIESIAVIKKGKVNKARLYYLRKKIGKGTRIQEEMVFDKKEDASLGEESVS
jgi:large subunit ribosomal protein L19